MPPVRPTRAHVHARRYDAWLTDPFENLEPEQMEKDLTQAFRDTLKAYKFFQDIPDCLAVAKTIRQQIESFRPSMPLVTALRQPGMRERHWEQLSKELSFELHPATTLRSLKDVFSLNLHAKEVTASAMRRARMAARPPCNRGHAML
jgi:hypothetical protein